MGDRADQVKDTLGMGSILGESWVMYKGAFALFTFASLIVLVPSALYHYFTRDSPLSLIPVDVVCSCWQVGAVILIVESIRDGAAGVRSPFQILGGVFPQLFWLLVLTIFMAFLIAFGLFALIVPGVILALMWIVALPVLLVEKVGVFESLGRSSDLTRHLRMRILPLGIVLAVPAILLAVVSFLTLSSDPVLVGVWNLVAGTVIGTFTTIIVAVLYFRLVGLQGSPQLEY